MARVTLQDIAKICEVDTSTVSRAMRGDPRVKASSRRRIKEAAERLGYRPNLLARNLAGGKTDTIWMILPSLDATTDYRLVRHVSHYCNERDYALFAALHDCDSFGALERHSVAHYAQVVERAGQGLVDGAIVMPRRHVNDAQLLNELVRQKFPMVFIDNYVEELPVPVVTTDNKNGAAELVRRCVQAGAERVILLFEEPNPVARDRLAGATQALNSLHIPQLNPRDPPESWTIAGNNAPLAVIGSSQYYLHRFVVQNARFFNSCPLIFGVFDEWTGEPSPAERVIIASQDCEAMARHAVDRLISLIDKKGHDGERIELIPLLEYTTLTGSFTSTV